MAEPITRGFGRLIAKDPDDKRYPMTAALRPRSLPKSYYYAVPKRLLPLDQGSTGTCVAHAWTGFMMASPLQVIDGPNPYDMYRGLILLDEWTENDREARLGNTELQFGSSVRAGAKHLQALGHVKSYVWSRSADEMAAWLLSKNGSIVLGTNWYWDMGSPDRNGYVNLGGGIAGGHAYLAIGYSRIYMAFRCLNSWGRGYGSQGRFWVRHADMDRLVRNEDGEACAATEQLVLPVAA